MGCQIATVLLLSCWELCHGADQVQLTAPKPKADPKQHYNMIPEVVDKLVLLAEQDRNILKTILANEALFYENLIIPMVLSTYNASHSAGDCAVSEERRGKIRIRENRKQLADKVDAKIDGVLREWAVRQTQDELEEFYMGRFWTDRAALYDFVSTKNKGVCANPDDESQCTGLGALEREAAVVMKNIFNCKTQ